MALQYCDFKLYTIVTVINYGFMTFATWQTAPYFTERRIDFSAPFAYFIGRLGGLTLEMVVMIFAGYSLYRIMSSHYRKLIEQFKTISAIANIYMTVYELDATTDTFKEITARSKPVTDLIGNTRINPQEMIDLVMKNVTDEDHLDEILKFVNISTLNDRLRDIDTIAIEYMNKQKLWRRGRFIVSARDENGKVTRLLWLAEDIDQEKRERDRLIDVSERAIAASEAKSSFLSNMSHEIRIRQIITNILTNAAKYTEKGSVTLKLSCKKTDRDHNKVVIRVSVTDTGMGIRPEDMEKLFAKFERIEEKKNRKIEGTGLGMNITKSLLEKMGSNLEVESVYGQGSTFSFDLEQKVVVWDQIGDYEQSNKDRQRTRNKYKEKLHAPNARVLVVDDNKVNLSVFRLLVKNTRIQTDTAESGDECLKKAADNTYDIIFLDHMMPGKDGTETLRELRDQVSGPNRNTPVICLTADAVTGAREHYIASGFTNYLTKPIYPEELENMLIEMLPEDKITLLDKE